MTEIKGLSAILRAFTVGIVLLAAACTYSAWVASTNHSAGCARIGLAMDAVHDIVIYATTPPPKTKISAAQEQRIAFFQAKAFHRLDQVRC